MMTIKSLFSWSRSRSWGGLLALIAGALMPLAFAPFQFYPIAVVAPAILLGCWLGVSPKEALWRGWLFGLGMFGVGVSWIYVSIHEFGNTAAPLAAFFTALFVMALAIFPALQGYVLKKFFPETFSVTILQSSSSASSSASSTDFSGTSTLASAPLSPQGSAKKFIGIVLLFPISWVLLEWIRSWFLSGFPWLLIGYSQVSSPLKGYIPLLGAYGVAFLMLFSSALIITFLLLIYNRSKYRWSGFIGRLVIELLILISIWMGGFYLSHIVWTQPIGKPVRVALIQGNIQQDLKWRPDQVRPTLKTYVDLTAKYWNSDIIVWPEAAIPIPLKFAQDFLKNLDLQAKAHNVTLITGIPVEVPNTFSFYNAMITLGKGSGHYYKRRLVPFGEYVPFGDLLRGMIALLNIPMSDMTSGPAKQPDLIAGPITGNSTENSTGNIKIAPFICYEIAYANNLYRELPQGNLLVTISDDAWFGDSLAPYQHLEMGQFRAIQGGRALLFSANNGITAIINAKGEVIKRVPQFVPAVLTGEVQPMKGSTPWIRYGGNGPIIMILGLLGLLIIGVLKIRVPIRVGVFQKNDK